jgi:hypothetical protein
LDRLIECGNAPGHAAPSAAQCRVSVSVLDGDTGAQALLRLLKSFFSIDRTGLGLALATSARHPPAHGCTMIGATFVKIAVRVEELKRSMKLGFPRHLPSTDALAPATDRLSPRLCRRSRPCTARGSVTNVPLPCRLSTSPRERSDAIAWRRVTRRTENYRISPRSLGRRLARRIWPVAIEAASQLQMAA